METPFSTAHLALGAGPGRDTALELHFREPVDFVAFDFRVSGASSARVEAFAPDGARLADVRAHTWRYTPLGGVGSEDGLGQIEITDVGPIAWLRIEPGSPVDEGGLGIDDLRFSALPPAEPPFCVGDIDGDGTTGVSDVTIASSTFGQRVPVGRRGDLDGDGRVGIADFSILSRDLGCQEPVCTAGEFAFCEISNGLGTQFCRADGSGFGSCGAPLQCDPGYTPVESSCRRRVCTPGSLTGCSIPNGAGIRVCNSSGTRYGSCQLAACRPGYVAQNGRCVRFSIPKFPPLPPPPPPVCDAGATRSCGIANGTGTQTCNGSGSAWGACGEPISCNAGYVASGGSCVRQVCTPRSVRDCTSQIPNAQAAFQSCDGTGMAYGSCTLIECRSGYRRSGNRCVYDPSPFPREPLIGGEPL